MWEIQLLMRLWCKTHKCYHESWETGTPLPPWVETREAAQKYAETVYPNNQDRVRVWHPAMGVVNE